MFATVTHSLPHGGARRWPLCPTVPQCEKPSGGGNSHWAQPSGGSDPLEIGTPEGPTLRRRWKLGVGGSDPMENEYPEGPTLRLLQMAAPNGCFPLQTASRYVFLFLQMAAPNGFFPCRWITKIGVGPSRLHSGSAPNLASDARNLHPHRLVWPCGSQPFT